MRYPQYPKYKSTPCSWLREIPEHWSFKRLKNIATHNDEALDEQTDPDFEIEYVDISSVSLTNGIEKSEMLKFEKAPSRARRKVKHGDIIVSTVRTYLKAIASINNPSDNMIVSTGFAVVRPMDKLHSGYAGYLLQSNGFVGEVVANSVGVSYPAINASDLVRIAAIEPPFDEQNAIARFLDFKTAQIDALIAKKQALLEKLAEKRTALISHAVTKGLDPSAPMKDSGVEWLGKIPTHWETKKGRRIGNLLGSITPSEDDILDEGGIAFAKVDDINTLNHDLTLTKTKTRISDTYSFINKRILLFPKRGAAIFTNKVAIAGPRITFDSNLMGWDIMEQCNIKFIAYCLLARRLDDLADVSTVPQINNKHIYPAIFPSPPLREQTAIATYLDNETTILEALAVKISLAIKCLQEYRSALITNAVTGKIDVRGCQVPEEIA